MKEYPKRKYKIGYCECGHKYREHKFYLGGMFINRKTERKECMICECPMYNQERTEEEEF